MNVCHHWYVFVSFISSCLLYLTLHCICFLLHAVIFFLFDQDMSQNPPWQELVAKDLHGNEWHFRHIFRGLIFFER